MQRSREKGVASPGLRTWAVVVLCLLFTFGTILHVAPPAQAQPSAPQVIAVSGGADLCEPGHAAGEHCQPNNGCPLCAPVGTALAEFAKASERPPMAAAALVSGGVIIRHVHPPNPALLA